MEKVKNGTSIAIIGMACTFPGSTNLDKYWNNIKNGINSISTFTKGELIDEDPNILNHKYYIPAKGVIEDIEMFDSELFGYSKLEADITDPQHKIFLQVAMHAFENSGYDPRKYEGSIGVFASQSPNSYYVKNILGQYQTIKAAGDLTVAIGNGYGHLATNVSYRFNLDGPSISIQTACSSSLVATHLAIQSLLAGDCDMALAGGVSIILPHKAGYIYQEGGTHSIDGVCRVFDRNASGMVDGEGCGIIILKKLDQAIKAKDRIYATIEGSAINNDGANKVGYTAPGVEGQIKVLNKALEKAGIDKEEIGYIETHGTGTILGDSIELYSLSKFFRGSKPMTCCLGTLKANIGHLDAASGIAGLIKAVLVLENKILPPNINCINPHIELLNENNPLYINKTAVSWNSSKSRYAGVSSFGIGGTNAHIIIKEAKIKNIEKDTREIHLFILSAVSIAVLTKKVDDFSNYLNKQKKESLDAIEYSQIYAFTEYPYRISFIYKNREELYSTLHKVKPVFISTKSIYFVLTGYEIDFISFYKLMKSSKSYVQSIEKCIKILKRIWNHDLIKYFENDYPIKTNEERSLLIFVNEYASIYHWLSLGLTPDGFICSGIGELVSACISNVISLSDALKLLVNYNSKLDKESYSAQQKKASKISNLNSPKIPFISTRSMDWITEEEATYDKYWYELVSSTHLTWNFIDDNNNLGSSIIFSPVLSPLNLKEKFPYNNYIEFTIIEEDVYAYSLNIISLLWSNGININWDKLYKTKTTPVLLPNTPFQNTIHWVKPEYISKDVKSMDTSTIIKRKDIDVIEQDVFALMAKICGEKLITLDNDFFDHGGSSLSAVQLITRIRDTFGVRIPLSYLFDSVASAKTLAKFIYEMLPSEYSEANYSQTNNITEKNIQQSKTLNTTNNYRDSALKFGVFFFSSTQFNNENNKYDYLFKIAKYADKSGFNSIWTPERHFDKFGGLFPNPATLSAALASITSQININAGSVVLPLHNVIRVAEEWSVVDNISNGRIGISIAPGFHPKDFLIAPESYEDRRSIMWEQVEKLRKLWRGESYKIEASSTDITIFPKPIQPELPIWITAMDNVETFRLAGQIGANILTSLLTLKKDELRDCIREYRNNLQNYFPGKKGIITLMLHTYIGLNTDEIINTTTKPLSDYLLSHLNFSNTENNILTKDDVDQLIERGLRRIYTTSGLIGQYEDCLIKAKDFLIIGVDEIACLIDFGISFDATIKSLDLVKKLSMELNKRN